MGVAVRSLVDGEVALSAAGDSSDGLPVDFAGDALLSAASSVA